MQVPHEHHLLPFGRRKDLLPPKSERSNRHRQAVPAPAEPAECDAFCLASVATKQKLVSLLGVSKVTAIAVAFLLYTSAGGLSRIFGKGVDFFRFCAIIKVRGNTGDGCYLRLVKITASGWKLKAVISFCSECRLQT